jgi:hypothetical protein
MKTGILCTILVCVASVGFVGWRVYVLKNREIPHYGLVEDPSLSHPEGCESLVGLAEKALNLDGISPGSTLTVLVIGDATTANEPWQLGMYSIPTTRKVLEGRTANSQGRQIELRDIWSKCQGARRTTVSPIFLGVKQAVANLRAQGCGETSHCQLFVNSDLEENVEPSIKKRLNGTAGEKPTLPSPVENDGIDVAFCGLAVTTGRFVDSSSSGPYKTLRRTPAREDRLREIWRSLFTIPAAVSFEPYCPKANDLSVVAPNRLAER